MAGFKFSAQSLDEIQERYDWFAEMRANHPVWYDEQLHMWHVFRYDDVQQVLTDYAHFSNEQQAGTSNPLGEGALSRTLVLMDPPRHRQYRNLVTQAFTPRAVARLAPRIEEITQELLDQARTHETIDFVKEIAFLLPATVIADLLGVPASDREVFRSWTRAFDSDNPQERINRVQMQDHRTNMMGYIAQLVADHRRSPKEDIVTDLINAEIDGERLNEDDLLSFCLLLLLAGHETTVNLLANTILCLTNYPDAMEQLRNDPGLAPSATEEVLRYLSPVWNIFRLTRSEVELRGQKVPAHQVVIPWMVSANRDERQFPNADVFDIRRDPNRHVAFGHGIHFCIGAPLARLESKIALPMILQQLPGLQRVPDAPIVANTGIVFAIKKLLITWDYQQEMVGAR
ncbi:MAG TPA: cytochrome P450 [Ktedonobacteraceae bacterium]|nr:cytochrome P450 [Ktedonobacteraceae bacterium]